MFIGPLGGTLPQETNSQVIHSSCEDKIESLASSNDCRVSNQGRSFFYYELKVTYLGLFKQIKENCALIIL